jgi:hypothetical protein
MSTSNGHDNGYAADEAIDALYAYFPGAIPAPPPCPEAAFSLTLKGTIGGHEALLTARGMTADEFTRNLQVIKGILDPVPQPAPQAASPGEGYCPVHRVQMKLHPNAKGTWYSHFVDGAHCKGR